MTHTQSDIINFLNLVPVFDGENVDFIYEFLHKVRELQDLINEKEKKKFLTLVVSCKITGKAFNFIENSKINNFEDLKSTLLQLHRQNNPSCWQVVILNESQKSNETVLDFGNRLIKIHENSIQAQNPHLSKENLKLIRATNEEFLLFCFRNGITNKTIKFTLLTSCFSTIAEAKTFAQKVENNYLSDQKFYQIQAQQLQKVKINQPSSNDNNNIFNNHDSFNPQQYSKNQNSNIYHVDQINSIDLQQQNDCNYNPQANEAEVFKDNPNRDEFLQPGKQILNTNIVGQTTYNDLIDKQNLKKHRQINNAEKQQTSSSDQITITRTNANCTDSENNQQELTNNSDNSKSITQSDNEANTILLSTIENELVIINTDLKIENLFVNSNLIVDTGADISLLKCNKINQSICKINNDKILELRGITDTSCFTLGTCELELINSNNESITHTFHIIPENVPIKNDGILGRDVLQKNNGIINYGTGELNMNNLIWKLLPYNKPQIKIPARSEVIVEVSTNLESGEGLCFTKKLTEGCLLGSCLTIAMKNRCIVPLINCTSEPIVIPVPTIELKELSSSQLNSILNINRTSTSSTNRTNQIKQILKLDHLNEEEKASINEICSEYAEIFFLDGDTLSCTNTIEHEIPTIPGSEATNIRPYRLPFSQRKIVEENIQQMLKNGVIEKSTSPYNAPLIVVPKKSGESEERKYRVVVDFRKLNNITIGTAYPLPNITDILDQLGRSKYFSTLDLASGFHQIPMKDSDKEKTAFSTHYGHFQFTRMPFGLKGAPSSFQRLMDSILLGIQGIRCFMYIDDLVIYASNLEEHNSKLREVFERLKQNNLKVKPEKCNFLRKETTFLGHQITDKGINPDPNNIKAVQEFQRPTKLKQVRAFLGLAGYYRKFIDGFSKIALPLNKLMKKNTNFEWNEQCENAFVELKSKLISPPLLQYPDFTKPFLLTTDASKFALGAVLSQGEIGSDLPIAFASRTLNDAETRYSTTEKEMLAIVWATKYFRPYLYGNHFTVITDHKPLTSIFNVKDPGARLFSFRIKLEEYDFTVKYKAGVNNTNADGLSRLYVIESLPTNYTDFVKYTENHIIINNKVTDSKIALESIPISHTLVAFIPEIFHSSRTTVSEIIDKFDIQTKLNEHGELNICDRIECYSVENQKLFCYVVSEYSEDAIDYENIWKIITDLKNVVIEQNINKISIINLQINSKIQYDRIRSICRLLFKDIQVEIQINDQCVFNEFSEEEKLSIIKQYHDNMLGGHQGSNRTYKRIKQSYFWHNLKKDVENYIQICDSCQRNKIANKRTKLPMEITTTARSPFEKLFMDVVGPLTMTESGNKYILTFQDDLTKFSDACCIPDQEAETIAREYVDKIVCKYGCPEEILHDQGTNFMSQLFKSVNKLLGIRNKHSTSYNPQTQGSIERSHRTLAEYLRHFINQDQTDWDVFIPKAIFTYNTTPHTTTGFTPFELMYGRNAVLPQAIKAKPSIRYNYDDYVDDLKYKFNYCHQIARENILKSKEKSKQHYDQNTNIETFDLGDQVLLHDEAPRRGRSAKLDPIWLGPYTVLSKDSPVNYTIKMGRKELKVHANRLKHYNA